MSWPGDLGVPGRRGHRRVPTGGQEIRWEPGDRVASVLVVLPLLLLSVVGPSAAAASPGSVSSYDPVQLTGAGTAIVDEPHLYTSGTDSIAAVHLEAESANVKVEWDQGIRSSTPPEPSRTKTDHGVEQRFFNDVAFTLVPEGDHAELLAFPDAASASATIDGFTNGQGRFVEDQVIASTGLSEDRVEAGSVNDANFSKTVKGPSVRLDADGASHLDGSFSLFVNNLTLKAEAGDGATWTTWSGYREEEPGAPASPYERRVVTLKITNGTLTTDPGHSVAVLGPKIGIQLEGALRSEDVSGSLRIGDLLILYEREILTLEGDLSVDLSTHTPGQDGTGEGDQAARGALLLSPSGSFRAVQTDLEGHGTVVAPASGGGPAAGPALWVLAIAAAAGVGAVVRPAVAHLASRMRQRRFDQAMADGKAAMDDQAWETAAGAYARATSIDPDASAAWFLQGLALLEARRFEACLDILEPAARASGMDRWDILQLEAAAAYGAGKDTRAGDVLERMAKRDPVMTRIFVDELGIELGQVAPGARVWIDHGGVRGGTDGYIR